MKKLLLASCLAALSLSAAAGQVDGYFRSDGSYVAPYQRSAPDNQRWNNYGSQTNGGSQRDEFSSPPAYNQPRNNFGSGYNTNPNYGSGYNQPRNYGSGY